MWFGGGLGLFGGGLGSMDQAESVALNSGPYDGFLFYVII